MATRRMSIGRAGESVAAGFLERRGATILDRNVRVGRDEIDLLVDIGGEHVAVEVKTALGDSNFPEDNFDTEKERNVRRAAAALGVVRIDLVTVELTTAGATVRWLPGVG